MKYPFSHTFIRRIAPLLVALAYADCAKSADISMSCSPKLQVNVEMANNICLEFKDMLAETFPQHHFDTGSQTLGIALTVTKASKHGLGLEVNWITSGRADSSGVPLSTSFFDRDSDTHLRRRFYEQFLLVNPLPF